MSNVHVSIVHEIYFSIWKASIRHEWWWLYTMNTSEDRICAWNCIKKESLTKSYFIVQNYHVNQTWHLTSICLNLRDIGMYSNVLNLSNLVQRLSHYNAYYLHLILGSKHMRSVYDTTYVGAISVKSPYTTKFIYCRMIIRQRGQAGIRERGSAGINSGTRPRGNYASLSRHVHVYIKNLNRLAFFLS